LTDDQKQYNFIADSDELLLVPLTRDWKQGFSLSYFHFLAPPFYAWQSCLFLTYVHFFLDLCLCYTV
jgi:hypothetical protein